MGVMPSPYVCERFHPTRGCSRRKYLFLKRLRPDSNARLEATGCHSHLSSRLNERRHRGRPREMLDFKVKSETGSNAARLWSLYDLLTSRRPSVSNEILGNTQSKMIGSQTARSQAMAIVTFICPSAELT